MTSVAFPKSIFGELAANLPRHACRTGESITMSSKRTWLNAGITPFNGKISLTFLFMLLAVPAFASGGSCPSGANYLNTTTGSLVTLASLGVTNCYFVAANGADTNSGTSEASPWLHSPGMQNCSSNCAAVTQSTPGLGFIFRGGDTWHFGKSSATPYAGVVTTCAVNGTVAAGLCIDDINGTSTNPIYYGVDPGWPSSGWARPILTADNSPCSNSTTGTMPDGATCVSATSSTYFSGGTGYFGQPGNYVSSCAYQVGNSNDLVDIGFSKYIMFDNFELTGLCQSGPQHGGSNEDTYIRYGSIQAPVYFTNLYIHGASHTQYAGPNGFPVCNAPAVCINLWAFQGGSGNGATFGEEVYDNVVDFADSDPGGQGLCFGGFWDVAYNVFRYSSNCGPNPLHTFHDNLYEWFFENGHSNLLEDLGEYNGVNVIYNNVFRHVEIYLTSGGGVFLWPAPPLSGVNDYIFNNIGYDVGGLEYFNFGGTVGNNALGNYVLFNNTFQTNVSQPIIRCSSYTNGKVIDTNNHFIDDGSVYLTPCSTLTTTTALAQTNAQADANVSVHFDQYTASETLGYSPVALTNSTVGAGTNQYSGYCSALSTAGLSAAATACQSDSTYACTYNTSNHTTSCSAQTVARPSSGAWDVGAYEFNAQDPPANPPTGLTAIVN
jgi:hypothetical protein